MNKKFGSATLILGLVLITTGCATPTDMKDGHKEEMQALNQYHKAQKKSYRAGEVHKAATATLVVATANKISADKDLKDAKKHLDEVLNQPTDFVE